MDKRSFLRTAFAGILISVSWIPLTSCTSPQLGQIVITPSSFTTTLAVNSAGASLPVSDQMWTQYKAIGYYGNASNYTTKDITDQVTWTSLTPLMVTVSSTGVAQVTGEAYGATQITASKQGYGGLITSNTSTFTVNKPS